MSGNRGSNSAPVDDYTISRVKEAYRKEMGSPPMSWGTLREGLSPDK